MDDKTIPKLEKGSTKDKAHVSSESHIRYLEAELTAKKGGSIAPQVQRIGEHE